MFINLFGITAVPFVGQLVVLAVVTGLAQQANIANPVRTTTRQRNPVIAVKVVTEFCTAMKALTTLISVQLLYFSFGECTFSIGFTCATTTGNLTCLMAMGSTPYLVSCAFNTTIFKVVLPALPLSLYFVVFTILPISILTLIRVQCSVLTNGNAATWFAPAFITVSIPLFFAPILIAKGVHNTAFGTGFGRCFGEQRQLNKPAVWGKIVHSSEPQFLDSFPRLFQQRGGFVFTPSLYQKTPEFNVINRKQMEVFSA